MPSVALTGQSFNSVYHKVTPGVTFTLGQDSFNSVYRKMTPGVTFTLGQDSFNSIRQKVGPLTSLSLAGDSFNSIRQKVGPLTSLSLAGDSFNSVHHTVGVQSGNVTTQALSGLSAAFSVGAMSVSISLDMTGETVISDAGFVYTAAGYAPATPTSLGLVIVPATGGFSVAPNGAIAVSFADIPTSPTGLPSGTFWNDGGLLAVAP